MYKKTSKTLFFLIMFFIWFLNPQPSYANYCTFQLFYKSTVVIATAENQTTECESYKTTTKFRKEYTIKGSSVNQFEIKTINANTQGICKDYPIKPSTLVWTEPDPQFVTGKKYLISIVPNLPNDRLSSHVSLPGCGGRIVTEVNGFLDPKVILYTIGIYTAPFWTIGIFATITLALFLGKFLPDILAFILSGVLILFLYGFVFYLFTRALRYLIRRFRKT